MMTHKPTSTPLSKELRTFAETLVSLIGHPAAVVAYADGLIAQNDQWASVTRLSFEPTSRLTLAKSLRDFEDVESLADAVRSGSGFGHMTLACARGGTTDRGAHEVTVRWCRIQPETGRRVYALLVIEDADMSSKGLGSVISSQQSFIDQLLIRQTLVEESERRRIGRVLHDGAIQNLALLRSAIAQGQASPPQVADMLGLLDRTIDDIRTLSFELSPPILEDLGLLPALHWLAEHIAKRYSANISCVDDASEPRLTRESRVVVFRAVRELAVNAAKHAPDSEIVISCVSRNRKVANLLVQDAGPGFETNAAQVAEGNITHFGLTSVEQQIRGIFGTFTIDSQPGNGTRALIKVPLLEREGVPA